MDRAAPSGRALPPFKAAALLAVLGGVVVGLVLSSGVLLAQVYIRQRLCAHETKLARVLSVSSGAAANVSPSETTSRRRRSPSTPPKREAGRARRAGDCSDDPTGCESAADYSAAGLHAAHFATAYVRDRHVVHEEMQSNSARRIRGDTGYLRWNHSGLSEIHAIYNTTRLTDSQKWLVIPEDGLYFVYSQVTWWGQEATTMYQTPTTDGLRNAIVLKAPNTYGSIELEAGMVTVPRDRCYGHCPLDSSYVSGIFHLDEGAQIGVMVSTTAAICTHSDKTFLGIFMIRQDLDE